METLYERRRYLPAIYSRNPKEKAHAERQAINTICQGSAADLIKKAMIDIHKELCALEAQHRQHQRPTCGSEYWAARMILQIHDELLFEVHSGYLDAVQQIVRRCMESAIHLRVPTPIKFRVGQSWGQLQP